MASADAVAAKRVFGPNWIPSTRMPISRNGRFITKRVVPTGQPHRRLANIARAVNPPGTTLLGFRKMSTDNAMHSEPARISTTSKSKRPVRLPNRVRSRMRRLKRRTASPMAVGDMIHRDQRMC